MFVMEDKKLQVDSNGLFNDNFNYSIENGKVVMSEEYLKKRKMCCGNGCRNCPFWPEHQKGNTVLKKELE